MTEIEYKQKVEELLNLNLNNAKVYLFGIYIHIIANAVFILGVLVFTFK